MTPTPASSGHYAVVRHAITRHNETIDQRFTFHEVFVTGDRITGISERPVAPEGNSIRDLQTELLEMARAFNRSVIDYDSVQKRRR